MRARLKVSRAGVELIKGFEGLRQTAARLPDGRWTLGYGHTFSAKEGARVTPEDAEALLRFDLLPVVDAINNLVVVPVNQNQFDALVSFVFNIGIDNFTTSNVLRRLNEGRFTEAALAMDGWRSAEFNGQTYVLAPLIRRRATEKSLFLTPETEDASAPSMLVRPVEDTSVDISGHSPSELGLPQMGDVLRARPLGEPDMPPAAKPVVVRMAEVEPSLPITALFESPYPTATPAPEPAPEPAPPAPQPEALSPTPKPQPMAAVFNPYSPYGGGFVQPAPTVDPLVEAQRLEAQRLEAQRLEALRLEAERVEAQRLEFQRLEAERLEAQRLEAQRLEMQRLEAERTERERLAREQAEFERLEAERRERVRLEQERIENEQAEIRRLEAERQERERREAERLEAERRESEAAQAQIAAQATPSASDDEARRAEEARKAEAAAALMRFYSPYASRPAPRPPAAPVTPAPAPQPVAPVVESFATPQTPPPATEAVSVPAPTPVTVAVVDEDEVDLPRAVANSGVEIEESAQVVPATAGQSFQRPSPSTMMPPVVTALNPYANAYSGPRVAPSEPAPAPVETPISIQPISQPAPTAPAIPQNSPVQSSPAPSVVDAPLFNWRDQLGRPLPATETVTETATEDEDAFPTLRPARNSRYEAAFEDPGQDWIEGGERIALTVDEPEGEGPSWFKMLLSTLGWIFISGMGLALLGGAAAARYRAMNAETVRQGFVQDYITLSIIMAALGILLVSVSIWLIMKRLGGLKD